jgi:hypothetical protein
MSAFVRTHLVCADAGLRPHGRGVSTGTHLVCAVARLRPRGRTLYVRTPRAYADAVFTVSADG